jgi:hypothetical protein
MGEFLGIGQEGVSRLEKRRVGVGSAVFAKRRKIFVSKR